MKLLLVIAIVIMITANVAVGGSIGKGVELAFRGAPGSAADAEKLTNNALSDADKLIKGLLSGVQKIVTAATGAKIK